MYFNFLILFFGGRKSPLAAAAAMAARRDKKNALKLLGGGATIHIGREMLCLPYAGFFLLKECKQYLNFLLNS